MALLSSTTATTVYNISCRDFVSSSSCSTPKNGTIFFSNSAIRPRRFHIRSSGDVSAETTPVEADESQSSIEAPEGPPSLISTLNVERALRGIPITDIDYYGVLGLRRGCSSEEASFAYKNKVEALFNRGLEEEELNKEMELLKESYRVLSSEQERRLYDWSLVRSEEPDRYVWPSEVDKIKPPPDEPPPQEAEDVGPTRLVGYFIFAWFILSFVLSATLNR